MRLIDADRFFENLKRYAAPEMVWDASDIEHKLNEMPTIKAEPVVYAHWVVRGGVPYCSACGEMLNGYSYDNDVSTTPRCSFCGAKMYGGAS